VLLRAMGRWHSQLGQVPAPAEITRTLSAFGVDSCAQRGALAADGVTIAILACGGHCRFRPAEYRSALGSHLQDEEFRRPPQISGEPVFG
jgi:hypothetical protein